MIELDSVVHLINKLQNNNDLKNFILFHANKASIRTTFKTPEPISNSSRASSADLTSTASTNLESTPVSLSKHQDASIANTSLNSFVLQGNHHSRNYEKVIKNDYYSLSYDFKAIDWSQEDEVTPLSDFDVIEQESLLINDLLYVLTVGVLY